MTVHGGDWRMNVGDHGGAAVRVEAVRLGRVILSTCGAAALQHPRWLPHD